ncbi:MAG: transporter associated domain-containing protein [Myxococcota bacterium]|nr:transporter associated domain-containing protein [Myxococcota bacterium]
MFAFTEAIVEEAMVPLIEVSALPESATCAEAVQLMNRSGHSRVPIYRERIDQVTGVLRHQDLLCLEDWNTKVTQAAHPALFVPESKAVDQLLPEMRHAHQGMAIVVDEYGGAVGIITVEDLLEEIVGDIEDESDRSRKLVRRMGAREWLAAGRAEREHLEQGCGLELPEGDFETLAGFILAQLGRIPRKGEQVHLDAFTFTITHANDRAILEITVRKHTS